jgi:hypothetical protein
MTARPKQNASRSEPYRRLVAARPCIHCGLEGSSQAAHGDEGKGAHIKSDDRTCYPACADGPVRQGCHSLIGMSHIYSREVRREMEADFARRTRAAIIADGNWPKNLPRID